MEDAQIISLYWARDEGAIPASDEKYGGLCRALSRNILGSSEDAEECVNDTWHRAWNAMPPQKPQCLRAFFAAITRNLSLNRWCPSWRTACPPRSRWRTPWRPMSWPGSSTAGWTA